jgi:hypothetical protein
MHMGNMVVYFFLSMRHTTIFMSAYATILIPLATGIAIYGYIPYLRGMVRGNTIPHPYSWSVWALLTAIGSAIQFTEGVGWSAVPLVTNTILTSIVSIYAFKKIGSSASPIQPLDRYALYTALIGTGLWLFFTEPLYAAIAITAADACGYIPTFRKGYSAPHEESYSVYLCSGTSHLLSLFSLPIYTWTIGIYQTALVILAYGFCVFLAYRKNVIHTQTPPLF